MSHGEEGLAAQKPSSICLGGFITVQGMGNSLPGSVCLQFKREAVSVHRLILANFTATDGYKPLICMNENVIVHLHREINLSSESECLIQPL